ncbi:MAG: TonB-dependent receptor [Phocaeicola sp.]
MKSIYILILLALFAPTICAANYTLKGQITSQEGKRPIEFVHIYLPQHQLWAVSDKEGNFTITTVPSGAQKIVVSCLGYAREEFTLQVDHYITPIHIALKPENIGLDEIVVTARSNKYEPATSYILDKTTLEHQQISTITDISSLLPGGKSASDNNLASSNARRFEIRANSGELGSPTFMSAVEVDGIRLSNNGSFSETSGIDVRNIATSNIESIEIITGIPSVEYGDVSGGVVKVNTQKGHTPFQLFASMGPKTKSYSLSKGVSLGNNRGILNMSLERTTSTADMASPYTTYNRNALTLYYSNTLGRSSSTPLKVHSTLSGNLGGYNTESDPDAFTGTYTTQRHNTIRAGFGFDWLLNKSFLTGVEGNAFVNYSDRKQEVRTNKSSSTSTAVFHGTENGYFIATDYDLDPNAAISLIPAGYWYEDQFNDNRPIEYNASLKLYHQFQVGAISSKIKIGANLSTQGNFGQGTYYGDARYAPTWRAYPYSELPFMTNVALYAENVATFPIGSTQMQLMAGVRQDLTKVDGSGYGNVNALSPRFSLNYTLINNEQASLKQLRVRGGFGHAVKLPSFATLYPEPSYNQQLTFAPGALADGTTYYAYHIQPTTQLYNPQLKWQNSQQMEVGIDATWGKVNISLNAYRNKSHNGYSTASYYTPFQYKFTDQKSIEGSLIPISDRGYWVDQQSGVVTLYDKSGNYPSQALSYVERTTYASSSYATNISPILREGLEWVVDFGRIPILQTSIRYDGSYYHYRGINETLIASMPASSQLMANGLPYKYVGYYAGSSTVANGSETHSVNSNLTLTTHLPKLRLLISLRIESTLYHATRNLSEYNGQTRGVVLENRTDYIGTSTTIYTGDQYVAVYPEYYVTSDAPDVLIPFEEQFLWAQKNDTELYNELAKLVAKSNTSYYFNKNRISPYYAANLTITKELGRYFVLSFYANNFLNNLSKVNMSWNNSESTLLNSSYIPRFNCGLSLRIKL